jgi:hypothetical protein
MGAKQMTHPDSLNNIRRYEEERKQAAQAHNARLFSAAHAAAQADELRTLKERVTKVERNAFPWWIVWAFLIGYVISALLPH